MHFCEKCSNMYYIKVNEDENNDENKDENKDENDYANSLIYYCRKCGHENKNLTSTNVCVSKVYIKQTKQNYNNIINSYTINDPTLPRSNTIICPSCQLSNNDDDESNVIYIRYDDEQLKYVYLCTKCNTSWKTMDRT